MDLNTSHERIRTLLLWYRQRRLRYPTIKATSQPGVEQTQFDVVFVEDVPSLSLASAAYEVQQLFSKMMAAIALPESAYKVFSRDQWYEQEGWISCKLLVRLHQLQQANYLDEDGAPRFDCMVTHPAELLENPLGKRQAWVELQVVQSKLETGKP